MAESSIVSSVENVARLLSKEWFVKGVLHHTAFKLANGETYLSVNRPAIDSYTEDVESFVHSHSSFQFQGETSYYKRAVLNVGNIRGIDIEVGESKMKVDVEVEPRDSHTKSHAGIFSRIQNKNLKNGQFMKVGPTSEEISTDTILLEVRNELLSISSVEECPIPPM